MPKLSSSILIHYEGTNFRIFITDDTITCFLCKQLGHLSSNCKNIQITSNNKIDQPNLFVPSTISDLDTFSPLIKKLSHEERQTNSKIDDSLPSSLLNDNPDRNPSDLTLCQETSKDQPLNPQAYHHHLLRLLQKF